MRDQLLGEVDAITAVTAADVQATIAKYAAGKDPIVAISQSPTPQQASAAASVGAAGVNQ